MRPYSSFHTWAIEAYTAVDYQSLELPPGEKSAYEGRFPLGECLAEKSIELIGRHLVTAVRDGENHDARDGMALAATLAQVFPSVYIIDEPTVGFNLGNSLVIATIQPTTLGDYLANASALPEPLLAEIARRARPYVRPALLDGPILRDDQAPIEQIVHGIVLRFLLGDS